MATTSISDDQLLYMIGASRIRWGRVVGIIIFAAVPLVGSSIYSQQSGSPQIEKSREKRPDETSISFLGLPFTDTDLKSVDALDRVKRLCLDETQVTDKGLAQLQRLGDLQMLSLNSTQVTDEGLKHLTGLASLKWLWLNNTQVTDAGLAHLKELTSLRRIYLAETQVTDEGVAELRRALPNLSFWAPDTQPSNDSPVVSDTGKEVTIIRPGMSLLPSLKALRRQGLRIRECCDRAISGREFEIDRPHGSADVLILDATSDHEHGGYVIKNIYWWINYEDDVNRPKGLRKNLHRSVLHLDVKNLPSPPTAKKAG